MLGEGRYKVEVRYGSTVKEVEVSASAHPEAYVRGQRRFAAELRVPCKKIVVLSTKELLRKEEAA